MARSRSYSATHAGAVDTAILDAGRSWPAIGAELTCVAIGAVEIQGRIYRLPVIAVAWRNASYTYAVEGSRVFDALASRLTVGVKLTGEGGLGGKNTSCDNGEQ
jgi:hypothetical protein